MYTYDQPNKDVKTMVLSNARVFAAAYDESSPSTYNPRTHGILDVENPPSGDWVDVGVVANVVMTAAKTFAEANLGSPETLRKQKETKREEKIEFVMKEFIIESISLLCGTSASNVMRTTAATEGTVEAGATRTVVTLGTGEGSDYTAGDRVCTAVDTAGLITSTNRAIIDSINGDELTMVGTGFPVAPTTAHKLQKYYAVEMLDVLGDINERTLLVFFDWEEEGVKRQRAVWYPRVAVSEPFNPDLKDGKEFADAKVSFKALATTQTKADGTSGLVCSMPYNFD